MHKILLVALASFFFFAACKNERPPQAEGEGNLAVPVKSESAQSSTPPPVESASQTEEKVVEKALNEVVEKEASTTPIQPAAKPSESEKETEKAIAPQPEKKSDGANSNTVVEEIASKPASPSPPEVKKETPAPTPKVEDKPVSVQAPSHTAFDELLRKYVSSSGKVNYSGLKGDVNKLNAYLETLKKNAPKSDWSKKEKLAFWINAYNAFTLKLIVDNYPVSSITNLEGGKPWDKKWIKIGDQTYSLNNIENDIIRPRFNEPRIHFAVNCAAKSCPPLLNQAWTASNLERNFEQQAKSFINNSSFNEISANKVKVSKIFEWYGEDFGNLINYLNQYSTTKINAGAKVEYKEYDWALNK